MRHEKKIISGLFGLIALAAAAWWFYARTPAPAAQESPAAKSKESPAAKIPPAMIDPAVIPPATKLARNREPEPVIPPAASASVTTVASSLALTKPAAPKVRTEGTVDRTAAPPPVDDTNSKIEIPATERMITAHASLRTPEVANPDSAGNRQILQTMVTKALARSASPPPSRP